MKDRTVAETRSTVRRAVIGTAAFGLLGFVLAFVASAQAGQPVSALGIALCGLLLLATAALSFRSGRRTEPRRGNVGRRESPAWVLLLLVLAPVLAIVLTRAIVQRFDNASAWLLLMGAFYLVPLSAYMVGLNFGLLFEPRSLDGSPTGED